MTTTIKQIKRKLLLQKNKKYDANTLNNLKDTPNLLI